MRAGLGVFKSFKHPFPRNVSKGGSKSNLWTYPMVAHEKPKSRIIHGRNADGKMLCGADPKKFAGPHEISFDATSGWNDVHINCPECKKKLRKNSRQGQGQTQPQTKPQTKFFSHALDDSGEGVMLCGAKIKDWNMKLNCWVNLVTSPTSVELVNCPECNKIIRAKDQPPT